ncbi:MAG: hypothetical protein NVSMB19_25200 [Vulcanimicrobiaceae bacterium]
MATEVTYDAGAVDEIAGLERKIAELHAARAQMVAERDEHERDASRAATVLGGLAQVHRELGILCQERGAARDAALAAREAAAGELARLRSASAAADADLRALEQRLSIARETAARLAHERTAAERVAAEADAAAERTGAQYDETARAAADVTDKYQAAVAEATIAGGRDVQFTDIEETLDREELLATARLHDARVRAETSRVEADLQRIRELEERLSVERADLERRLRSMRSASGAPAPALPREPHERHRISLAARLRRDLGDVGVGA